MKKRKYKKKKEENCFVEIFKDIRSEVVTQIIISIIWNTILFIPRMIIRLYNNLTI